MNIDELIEKFKSTTEDQNTLITSEFLSNLKSLLGNLTNLRIFFAKGAQFGHLANTLTILKRFIGLGYRNNIQVIYDDGDVIDKLATLIPGLNQDNLEPLEFEGVQLTFHRNVTGILFTENSYLCVNGGNDQSGEAVRILCVKFNVQHYLQLQPFRWPPEKETAAAAARVLCTNNGELNVDLIDLEEEPSLKRLKLHALYTEVRALENEDWNKLESIPKIDTQMLARAQVIVTATNGLPRPIHLLPIYGLYTGSGNAALTGNPNDILFSVIASIALAQRSSEQQIKKGPAVIAVMTRFQEEKQFWDGFKLLFNTPNRGNIKKLEDYGYKKAVAINLLRWVEENNLCAGKRVKLCNASSGKELQDIIRNAQPHEIIVTYIPGAPQSLFNYLYSLSTLPPIFEGQGTANLMLNLGKPYWHMARENVNPYPCANKGIVNRINRTVFYLQQNLSVTFINRAGQQALYELTNLILESLSKDSDVIKYHAKIGELYHNEINDALLMTLSYLLKKYPYPPPSVEFANLKDRAISRLEGFYNTLLENDTKGVLNFIPGALAEGTLRNYLAGIIGNPSLEIGNAGNSVVIDFPEPKNRITVTGKTKAFTGDDLVLSLDFTPTADNQKIDAAASLRLGTIKFPEVPWFQLKNTMLSVTVPGNDDRITGRADFQIVFGSTPVDFSIDFPTLVDAVLVSGSFGDQPPAIEDLLQVLGGINFVQSFPPPFNIAANLGLKRLQIGYDYQSRKIESFNVGLETRKPWPLFGKLILDKLDINVNIIDPIGKRSVSWTASSAFKIDPGQLDVGVSYPNLTVSALMPESSAPIPVGNFLTFFLSPDVTLALGASVSNFSMWVQPGKVGAPTTYIVDASLDTESWNLTLNDITFGITGLGVNVSDEGSGVMGRLSGNTVLFKGDPDLELLFFLSASYLGKGSGWLFEGHQGGNPIKVKHILEKYVSADWAADVSEIDISDLYFKLQTPTGESSVTSDLNTSGTAKAYEVGGSVKVWDTPLGNGFETTISAKFGYNGGSSALGLPKRRSNDADFPQLLSNANLISMLGEESKKQGRFGEISADIRWNGIQLTVFYNFQPGYQSYGITWGILSGKIEKKSGKDIATLSFTESTTLASIIETMIGWATGSKFGLVAPWNILGSIPLNNLSLVYNFTDKKVGFNISIGPIEMGFARIDSITISYNSNQPDPNDNGVILTLHGSFLWQDNPSKPLSWDATKPEQTPAPSGNGNQFLDLRLLAMGQHVTVKGFADADTVQKAIALMADMPDPKPGKIPAVEFDPQSSWLFGADFGILKLGEKKKSNGGGDGKDLSIPGQLPTPIGMALVETEPDGLGYLLTLQIVFNDPHMYGLRIALDGDAAKILKGLDFQIMYRQVSPTVGVYQTEIALPEAMRHLSVGSYNITLPVFGIAVYTNGDFQLDIGFPWNEDFTRSFSIEGIISPGIPVMGSAGFYFGKLSSASSKRVPKATNGTFNPVLVAGFGMQIGIGRSLHYGVLHASFSLTVVGILEGVLAKWNPYQLTDGGGGSPAQIQDAYYFWLRGTVGIIGKIYGTVDFAIIKADFNLQIKLLLQFTYEAYVSIAITVIASVDVSVSLMVNLGVFKINIHLSFSMRLKETFSFDNHDTTPWQVEGKAPQNLLYASANHRLRSRLTALERRDGFDPSWSNLSSPNVTLPLTGYIVPALTMARDERDPKAQVPCYIAMLFIDSVRPAKLNDQTSALKADGQQVDTSFETLCKSVLRWMIASIQPQPLRACEFFIIRGDKPCFGLKPTEGANAG